MITHDFLNGVCAGMAVVNLLWGIAATIFVRKIFKGGQE